MVGVDQRDWHHLLMVSQADAMSPAGQRCFGLLSPNVKDLGYSQPCDVPRIRLGTLKTFWRFGERFPERGQLLVGGAWRYAERTGLEVLPGVRSPGRDQPDLDSNDAFSLRAFLAVGD